jgi:hypothetical protein
VGRAKPCSKPKALAKATVKAKPKRARRLTRKAI